ncbi:hypothetical protein [Nocardioides sp. HB32]
MKVLHLCRRTHLRRGNDDGAMLIIAIIVITAVAVVTGAVLSHGSANLRSTIVLRGVASTSYAADAGAKVAINNLRLGSTAPDWTTPAFGGTWNDSTWNGWVYTNYADGTGCFGADGSAPRDTLLLNNLAPASGDQTGSTSVRVECGPVAGTGILGGGSGVVLNSTDPFAQALSTTSSASPACSNSTIAACSGVYLKVLGGGGNNTVNIGGGVDSAGGVTAENGTVTAEGYVHANQTCTGTILSSDLKCSPGSAAAPAPVPAVLTAAPTPVYTSTTPYPVKDASGTCSFTAGTYASGKALTDAVTACPLAHFASGKYYFHFQDANPADRVWDIASKVIGGVRTTGSANVPGACRSPINENNGGSGVQFVFGGESRITFTKNAAVELCGPSGTGAPITIAQQMTTGPSATISEPQAPVTTTTTTSFGPEAPGIATNVAGNANDFVKSGTAPIGTSDTLAGALQKPGDSFGAKWQATAAGNGGTLDLSAFADSIPAGATVTSAVLHIASSGTPSADVKFGVSVNGSQVGNNFDPNVDVSSNALRTALEKSGGSSPKVQIAIANSGNKPAVNSNVTLDQVTLTVTYTKTTTTTPPPVVTTVPLEPWSSTSNFIDSTGGATAQPAKFVIQGATYAPNGVVHIEDSNADLVAFRWGLVAAGVDFKTYPQNIFGYPLVSIPALGPGVGNTTTAVDLTVFVCVNSSNCASGGVETLRSRVLITDPPYTDHPVVGKRQIRVLSWAVQR